MEEEEETQVGGGPRAKPKPKVKAKPKVKPNKPDAGVKYPNTGVASCKQLTPTQKSWARKQTPVDEVVQYGGIG